MKLTVCKIGDKGPEVSALQAFLLKKGFDPGFLDGDYGPKTAAAVRGLQILFRLPASGEFNAETLAEAQPEGKVGVSNVYQRPGFDRFKGIHPGSGRVFVLDDDSRVILYKSKLDIDGDGSDPPVSGDTYQGDTWLHDTYGKALSSHNFPFVVLPGYLPGAANLQDDGAAPGDKVILRYQGRQCEAIYGDIGPRTKLGEASIFVAKALGIPSSPVSGGLQVPIPGVEHIVFVKTGNIIYGKTNDTPETIKRDALALLAKFDPDSVP